MKKGFAYYEGPLESFVELAINTQGTLIKRIIADVNDRLVEELCVHGIAIDMSYNHTIDNNAIRHIMKCHGIEEEALRGQIPVDKADLLTIPEVLSSYDSLSALKNRRGQDVIVFSKLFENSVCFYVEEVRLGRHELAAITLYKRKKEDSPTLID